MPKGPAAPAKQFSAIPPQLRTPSRRAAYLERKSVKRWLRRNAKGLSVVDVRYIAQFEPEIIEWAEIYHVIKNVHGKKVLKCRLITGDPPPRIPQQPES